MYIISRCLLGCNCKYNGGNNLCEEVREFCRTHDYVTVCPETAAGLEVPRVPAEIVSAEADGSKISFKVVNREGTDVSEAFDYGARLSLASVLTEAGSRKEHAGIIEGAVLKANSPSCGSGTVYDGTFTGTLTKGLGVFTDKLIDACLDERKDPYISDENRLFSPSFRVCDENSFLKAFGDQ